MAKQSRPLQEPAEGAAPGSQISELQRLRSIVDAINADTFLVPTGSLRLDASGKVVPNDGFSGVAYPDKLESYIHGMVSLQVPNRRTVCTMFETVQQHFCLYTSCEFTTVKTESKQSTNVADLILRANQAS